MAVQSRVAAVTGANKGIGLAIVRNLALQYPKSPLHSGPLTIYLTARSPERGAEAVQTLQNDPQLKKAKVLAQDGGDTTIRYHALDISASKSIQEFAAFLRKEHPDGIDIVINNAAVALDGFDLSVVKNTLQPNYYGTVEATQSLLPLLRPQTGRLVNVSSTAGRLSQFPAQLQQAFRSAAETSVPAVTALMQSFQDAVEAGREKEEGWPRAAYSVSKAGVTAMTKVVAKEEKAKGSGVLINACCPGYVRTDMTKGGGMRSPDQGAQTPVMLALGELGGKTGGFWRDERELEW